MLARLEQLAAARAISPLDFHFVRLLHRLDGNADEVALAACLLSQASGSGDVCLDLARTAGQTVLEDDNGTGIGAPALAEWLRALRASPVVGRPGEYRPLILDDAGRLYLYRYWDYERRLAEALARRLAAPPGAIDELHLREGLARLFPAAHEGRPDWQKVAAATAALRPFCIISGGPGTGKTTTMVKILALLLEQAGDRKPAIVLAAPTGKAAARMQDAVREARTTLALDADVRAAIPESATTIHRLLRGLPDSSRFRHGAENPLVADVLVIDEASMVDLALMTKLIEALPPRARLILLGDKDQLASVESGAILGDLCAGGAAYSAGFARLLGRVAGVQVASAQDTEVSALRDSIVLLAHSYRFSDASGIKRLADHVNAGNDDGALATLAEGSADAMRRTVGSIEELQQSTVERVLDGYAVFAQRVKAGAEARAVLEAFNAFRVLSALRQGPAGTVRLNRLIDDALRARLGVGGRDIWYAGRPVIVTRNDYNLKLYNGDIGVALPDPAQPGRLAVFFPAPDGGLRQLGPNRLPEHESAYAMTVHKSQGSEFERVLFVLPLETAPVLTRELIYTGITRARKGVELLGSEAVLRAAIARTTVRASGLRARLSEQQTPD